MAEERETIKFKDEKEVEGIIHEWNDECDFNIIESTQKYFDSEKGYVDYDIIIQRKSDSKYFKGEYSQWGQGVMDIDLSFKEVFQYQTTITKYR